MCDVILYLQVNDEIKLLKKYALKKKTSLYAFYGKSYCCTMRIAFTRPKICLYKNSKLFIDKIASPPSRNKY